MTDEQIAAARQALACQDGVNSRGIARALVKAYDAWSGLGKITARNPAAILILDKLMDLAGCYHSENTGKFARCLAQCQELDELGNLQEARLKYLFQSDEVKAQFERDREYAVAHGMIANFEYCERSLGRLAGEHRILIAHDNMAHSFSFAIVDDQNERAGMNGGMIFHEDRAEEKKPWQLHT